MKLVGGGSVINGAQLSLDLDLDLLRHLCNFPIQCLLVMETMSPLCYQLFVAAGFRLEISSKRATAYMHTRSPPLCRGHHAQFFLQAL